VLDQLRRRGRVGVEQVFLDQEPPLAVEELEGRRRRQVDPGVARDRADSGRERLGDDREEPSGESSRSVVRLARVPSSSSSTISWKLIAPQVPIVMALIALDDGPEVISTIVDEDRLETEIRARVEPAAEAAGRSCPNSASVAIAWPPSSRERRESTAQAVPARRARR
jgi:hypothetical protein